jgi:hypothetical protein
LLSIILTQASHFSNYCTAQQQFREAAALEAFVRELTNEIFHDEGIQL